MSGKVRSLGIGALVVQGIIALGMANAAAATFQFRSTDDPGEGFNDLTPFTPVGGNSATTLGAARMNVMNEAGRVWGTLLVSNVTIVVDVAFNPLTCDAGGTTLGSAGPRLSRANFAGVPRPNVLYASALADALSNQDLNAGSPSTAGLSDITAQFNSDIRISPACTQVRNFYYGFDHNRGSQTDLLLVALHELGHGLGFTSNVSLTTGQGFVGGDGIERFSSYVHFIYDEQATQFWPLLTASERVASATRTGSLTWNGAQVNAIASRFTQGVTITGHVRLYAPNPSEPGSSVSHFDLSLSPHALMRPNISTQIVTSATDITPCALRDMGWQVTRCPDTGIVNTRPTANSQSVSVAEDSSILITLTGTDAESDPLSFAVSRAPNFGTLSAISSTSPRTITYTPFVNSTGPDNFQFTVSDSALVSTPATVSITVTPVSDPPVANPINNSVQSGQSVSLLLIGSDPDGDIVTYTVLTNPASGTLTGTAPSLTYQANSGFTGTDTFTYRVNDGTTDSAAATVTIAVSAPPVTNTASSGGSGGGGGGALGELWLALLWAMEILRRTIRKIDALST